MDHSCMFSIDFCVQLTSCSHVVLHAIEITYHCMRIIQANKCEPCHEHKQELQDVAGHKPFFKGLYCTMHACFYKCKDKSMDKSNILMLSMEPRKWSSFFTIITVSLLIQSSVDILLDSRNPAIAKTKCCMCYYHAKMIEHTLCTHSPLISASAGTRYLLLSLY